MATINLEFYKGSDLYSDGDIENDIAAIVKAKKDVAAVLAEETRWPVIYHLSPLRRNLLEWYDLPLEANILEIGAGCGALTELFCEKAQNVVAVELSKRRAEIIKDRLDHRKNLSIYVGSIEDMKFPLKFDIVTLIGVLEYAGSYVHSPKPHHALLKMTKNLLKRNGTLILALENKFGLKYWAGAREDHTGGLFDGIEGYPGNSSVATFGKHELSQLLNESGFLHHDYYYPMPDYKFAVEIFSDEFPPVYGQIRTMAPNHDRDRFCFFNEPLVFNNLIKNNMFSFFANSYLLLCKKTA